MGSGGDEPQGRYPWRRHCSAVVSKRQKSEGDRGRSTYMSRQVFPQAPSPTMTSLRRISAICATGQWEKWWLKAKEMRAGAGVDRGR